MLVHLLGQGEADLLYVVPKRQVDKPLDVGGPLHLVLVLEEDGDARASKLRQHEAEFEHDVLSRAELLFVLSASSITLVVGCGENNREPHVVIAVSLELLDERLPFRRELIEDERLQVPPSQHGLKLSSCVPIVAVDHKHVTARPPRCRLRHP